MPGERQHLAPGDGLHLNIQTLERAQYEMSLLIGDTSLARCVQDRVGELIENKGGGNQLNAAGYMVADQSLRPFLFLIRKRLRGCWHLQS